MNFEISVPLPTWETSFFEFEHRLWNISPSDGDLLHVVELLNLTLKAVEVTLC